MADSFESAWLKWAWAVVDSNTLAREVSAFSKQGHVQIPLALSSDYDAKRHCIVLSVAEIAIPFPPHWGLLLGNAVHNFRSAFDHLAWALYKRGKTPNLPPEREKNVYFPIADTRRRFNNSLPIKLPGVRRADIAKVRLSQPYLKGERNLDRHVLWVINELSRADKHRTIQPVVPVPERLDLKLGQETDCIYRRASLYRPRGILEPGAELARLYVKKTGPDPYIGVQPGFTLDPAINARLTLEEFLKTTITFTRNFLTGFAQAPESAKEIVKTRVLPGL